MISNKISSVQNGDQRNCNRLGCSYSKYRTYRRTFYICICSSLLKRVVPTFSETYLFRLGPFNGISLSGTSLVNIALRLLVSQCFPPFYSKYYYVITLNFNARKLQANKGTILNVLLLKNFTAVTYSSILLSVIK